MADATYIIYTGLNLPYIGVTTNTNLAVALSDINTAVNNMNPAPDYSGYNLYCVKQTDGTTHPTNTQNFAEGISKNLCDFHTAYNTFTGTTYPAAISTLTNAVNGLINPAITYAPFSITDTDTITQVLNKNFTGIGTILTAIDPSGGTWSTLSITPPTTITTGFNSLISYIDSMNTTIAGKQPLLPTFNNTINCLDQGDEDSLAATLGYLITYACNLPTFTTSGFTWGGINTASNLQDTVQSIANSTNYLLTYSVISGANGISNTAIGGAYDGYRVSMDQEYMPYYKVALTTDIAGQQRFLDEKIVGDGTTIVINTDGDTLVVSSLIPNPNYKVKVISTDPTPNYLIDKFSATKDPNWGVIVTQNVTPSNTQVAINATLDPLILAQNLLTYISNTPEVLTQFQQLVNQINGGSCAVPTGLTVVLSGTDFDLAWTPSGSATSQNCKWRQTGTSAWYLTGFTSANPQTSGATSATLVASGYYNLLLDFVIDSVCSGGGIGSSNLYQMIKFHAGTNPTYIVSGASPTASINVYIDPVNLDTIQYRLVDSGSSVVDSITTTGLSPNVTFTNVVADTYSVEYRLGTLVNGVTLYSDDSSQIGSWSNTGFTGIVVS